MELLVIPELKVLPVILELKAIKEKKVRKAPREILVLLDQKVKRGKLEPPEIKVRKGR